jgi:AcrR family transcriptional regulator
MSSAIKAVRVQKAAPLAADELAPDEPAVDELADASAVPLTVDGIPCVAPPLSRRRGDVLVEAIRSAARAELAAVGYVAFSIESVAARARTGKASIYRRWGSKQGLVLDVVECVMPDVPSGDILDVVGRDTPIRDALLFIFRRVVDGFTGEQTELFRSIASDCGRDPALAELVDTCLVQPRRAAMLRLLAHGVERGEVRPGAVTEQVSEVGPAMIFHSVLTEGCPPPDERIVSLVDNVIMPILRP